MRLYTIPSVALVLSSLLSLSLADDLLQLVGPPKSFKDGRGHHIPPTLALRSENVVESAVSCRTLCAPGSCGSSCPASSRKVRRNIIDDIVELDRRVLDNPAGEAEIDAYVVEQTGLSTTIPIYDNIATDTTSVWRRINPRVQQTINIGLTDLVGCTALVVVSPSGVYASHHWEVPGFSPLIENGVVTEAVTFPNSVIGYLLANGATGLAARSAFLQGGFAFILTPGGTGTSSGVPIYAAEIEQMKAAVNQAVPGLGGPVQVSTYVPLEQTDADDIKLLDETSRGRLLFQYDSNNNGERTMRLYFENQLVYETNLE